MSNILDRTFAKKVDGVQLSKTSMTHSFRKLGYFAKLISTSQMGTYLQFFCKNTNDIGEGC